MTQTTNTPTQLKSVEDAIGFLKLQGFQINHIDGIYRVRKEGWGKRPYELDAETLIQQANIIHGATKVTDKQTEPQESELDRAERRLMETCHKLDAQLKATVAEIRIANEAIRKLRGTVER